MVENVNLANLKAENMVGKGAVWVPVGEEVAKFEM